MIDELFINENLWIQKIDPRVRILFSVVYSFVVALSSRFVTLTAALGLSVLMVIMVGVSFRVLSKRLLAFNSLVLLFWLLLPLTFTGEALYHWDFFGISLVISKPGVVLAGQITLKSNAIMLVFITFITTSPVSTMAYALQKLWIPSAIIHILLLTYRYVFVIEQEYQRLMRAIKTRGFVPKTNLHTYRTYAYLVGMIFVRSVDRAHRVHQAMICRGFHGKFYGLERFFLTPADYGVGLIFFIMVVGIGVLEWASKLS